MAMTGGTSVLVHSGLGGGQSNFYIKLYVYYKTSQDVSTNKSTITCGMYITSTYNIGKWTDSYGSYVGKTSNTFTGTIPSGTSGTLWLTENQSFTVDHATDGTGSATIYWKLGVYSTWGGFVTPSGNFSITLPNIPRISKPTVNVSTLDFGSKVTIYTNRASTSFVHKLFYKYGTSGWIAITPTPSVGDNYEWTVPTSLANQIPNASKLDITIGCDTYYNNGYIGEDYAYITATVPTTSAYYPTISDIAWTKSSGEPSSWPMTQNISRGTMSMTGVSGAYGSTIKSYSLTFAGYSSTSSSLTVPNISSYGSLKAIATVTDTRERSFTKEVTFNVTAYHQPQLTIVSAYRSDSSGNEDTQGGYLYIKASSYVCAVGNNSLQSLTLQYKKRSATSYTSVTLTNNTARLVALSSDYTWDWIVTASDLVLSVSSNGTLPTGEVVLDILYNGKGIGLGKVAEREGLDSAWDFSKNGVAQTDYVVETGSSGIWTYRKWASGVAECWGRKSCGSVAITVAWGYLFESAQGYSENYPSGLFVNMPKCFYIPFGGGGLMTETIGSGTAAVTHELYFVRPVATTTDNCYIDYYAVGRWKN